MPLSAKEAQVLNLQKPEVAGLVLKIKNLSIELQRNNPVDWNNFLNVALFII